MLVAGGAVGSSATVLQGAMGEGFISLIGTAKSSFAGREAGDHLFLRIGNRMKKLDGRNGEGLMFDQTLIRYAPRKTSPRAGFCFSAGSPVSAWVCCALLNPHPLHRSAMPKYNQIENVGCRGGSEIRPYGKQSRELSVVALSGFQPDSSRCTSYQR